MPTSQRKALRGDERLACLFHRRRPRTAPSGSVEAFMKFLLQFNCMRKFELLNEEKGDNLV